MQTKTLQMKRALHTALLVLLLSVVGMGKGYAEYNYDFSAVCSSGQTLYYKITDATNHYVKLTCPYVEVNDSQAWQWHTMPTGNLTLPNTVKNGNITYTVTSIGNYAFTHCADLTSVIIPNTVTIIGVRAFSQCSKLSSINISNSVTQIQGSAFYGSGLTSITIPPSITSIGLGAFTDCTKLKKVSISDLEAWCKISFNLGSDGIVSTNPLYCAEKLYLNGSLITNLQIPDGMSSIRAGTFINAKCIKTIEIPSSVTSIGFCAFWGCSELISVSMPNTIIEVGASAFMNCNKLSELTLSESLSSIGDYAFSNCSSLTAIPLPNSLTSVGKETFSNCTGITSITIPYSVTSIGNHAFSNCNGLIECNYNATNCIIDLVTANFFDGCNIQTLNIGENVQTIPKYFFSNCYSLTTVVIPNSVTTIGNYAFGGCNGLSNVFIGDSVSSIGNMAFYNCTNLKTLTLSSNNLTEIGALAFQNCNALEKIIIEDVKSWCKIQFSGQDSNPLYYAHNLYLNDELIENLVVPNEVDTIRKNSFQNASFTSISLPNTLKTIEDHAFYNCSRLNTIIALGATPPTITNSSFYGISSVATVFVPCGSQMAYFSNWNMFEYNNIHEDCVPRPVSISSNINGGTVTPSASQATMGQEVRLTVTPNPGMTLLSLTVYNATDPTQIIPITPVGKTSSIYSFVMPPYSVEVSATFEHGATYSISVSPSITGGSVTASSNSASAGETITLNIRPNSGYELQSLTVCNANDATQMVSVTNNTFVMPSFNVLIKASFNYTSVDENGNVLSSIHPNPTSGIAKIEAEGLKHIAISNVLGQQIFNGSADGDAFEYDFGQYGAGVYLVRIETSEGVATKRVVVTQ